MFDHGPECSGLVKATGLAVSDLRVGDRVLAQASSTSAPPCVQRNPWSTRFPQICLLPRRQQPIVYTTAIFALEVARLRRGETVLTHSTAGGLGRALLMVCRYRGADVFVSVGTPEKKRFLMEMYGMPEERIFGSRDAGFAAGVMRATGERGVDVIFNSLSGEPLRATWECTALFARFIELGKRDMTINPRLETGKVLRNVSSAAVGPGGLVGGRVAAEFFKEAVALVTEGKVGVPRPVMVYGMAEVEQAMRVMQSGRHMGKLVLAPRAEDRFRVCINFVFDMVGTFFFPPLGPH